MNYLQILKNFLLELTKTTLIPVTLINLIDSFIQLNNKTSIFLKNTDINNAPDIDDTQMSLEEGLQYDHIDRFIAFFLFLRYECVIKKQRIEDYDITVKFISDNRELFQTLKKENFNFYDIFIEGKYQITDSPIPLIFASQHDLLEVVSILLELNATHIDHRHLRGFDGKTLRNFSENLQNFNKFLQIPMLESFNAKHLQNFQDTALHIATKNNNTEIVRVLYENNANLNVVNKNQQTPLHIAIENQNSTISKLFLNNKNVNVDAKDRHQDTPLYLATKNNDQETFDELLRIGANVNYTNSFNETPLHIATKNNNKYMITQLLNKNADINAQTALGNTPLHIAVINNNIEIAEFLIEHNAKTTIQNHFLATPLHIALTDMHLDIAKLLIINTNDLNIPDIHGKTALHIASEYNQLDIVKDLIAKSKDSVALYDLEHKTPLSLATQFGITETANYLYNSPYLLMELETFFIRKTNACHLSSLNDCINCFKNNPNKYSSIDFLIALILVERQKIISNKSEQSAQSFVLIKTIIEVDDFLSATILKEYPIFYDSINTINIDVKRPISSLHFALMYGYWTTASILIELKMTDLNLIDPLDPFGNTALHLASMFGNLKIVKLLCQHNANVYALNACNETPLALAKTFADFNPEIEAYLISEQERKAPFEKFLTEKSKNLLEAKISRLMLIQKKEDLFNAVEENDLEKFNALIDQIDDIDMKNSSQETLLHIASTKGYIAIANILVEKKADINALDYQEATPLHRASARGHIEIVELLISKKANIDAQTKYEKLTPLHFACIYDNLKVVNALITNHAKVNQVDEDDKTPLHYAYQNGYSPIVKLLCDNSADEQVRDIYEKTPSEYAEEQIFHDFKNYLQQQVETNFYKPTISSNFDYNDFFYFSCL